MRSPRRPSVHTARFLRRAGLSALCVCSRPSHRRALTRKRRGHGQHDTRGGRAGDARLSTAGDRVLSPQRPWARAPLDVLTRSKGESMTEEGTLSIVRCGNTYQVRYASTNPYGMDRQPYVCPDEAHLGAFLRQLGIAPRSIHEVFAALRKSGFTFLLLVLAAEQRQAFFRPTTDRETRREAVALPSQRGSLAYDQHPRAPRHRHPGASPGSARTSGHSPADR